MLDIKFIRDNPELIKEAVRKKRVNFDVEKLLAVDERRRHVLGELEAKRAKQNSGSRGGPKSPVELEELKKNKEEIKILEEEMRHGEEDFEKLMMQVPNIPSDDTPEGPDASGNKVLRQVGKLPQFDFKPKEHWELGQTLGVIDIENAAKVSGTRFAYLKGALGIMEFALIQLVLSVLTS